MNCHQFRPGNRWTGGGVAWLTLALLMGGALWLRVAGAEIAYMVAEVPLAPVSKPLLNDKGQVLTWLDGTNYIYLPVADYGLAAGVHPLGLMPAGGALIDFNTNGHFVTHTIQGESQGALFKDGEVLTFPAQTVLALDPEGHVLLQHARSGAVSTPAVRRADGFLTDAVAVLPGDTYYFFNDLNDAGIAVGYSLSLTGSPRFYRTAIWNTRNATVQFLPSSGFYNTGKLINNKDQIFGHRDLGYVSGGQLISTGRVHYLYLPSPDYGLPAGFTDLPEMTALLHQQEGGPYDARLTDHGEIYIGGQANPMPTSLWYRGELIRPDEYVRGSNTVNVARIFDVNNHGVVLATGALNGLPGKLFLLSPAEFLITAPANDELVAPDGPYPIRFKAPTDITAVNLYLVERSQSSARPRTNLIAAGVSAAAGTYMWNVPANLLSPSTYVIAVDAADPTSEAVSPRFRVREPWWLHRVVGTFQEPEYESFDAREHAFSFLPQGEDILWTPHYWGMSSRAYWDANNGFDPFIGTEVRYHPFWFGQRYGLEYPPWDALVRAFGLPGTYTSPRPWTLGGVVWNQPNPEAALWWNEFLDRQGGYVGACYGISLATMAAFLDPNRFAAKWLPGSGPGATLASFDASNEVLDALHALQAYQYGRVGLSEWRIAKRQEPSPAVLRDAVVRVKAMLERDDRERDRSLIIESHVDERYPNGKYRFVSHAVVPIWMSFEGTEGSEEGLYTIGVVDPNYSSFDPEGLDANAAVYLDTVTGKWWHSDSWWFGATNQGVSLSVEAIQAFAPASTEWPHAYYDGSGRAAGVMAAQSTVAEAEEDTPSLSVGIIGRGGAVTSAVGELRYESGEFTQTLPGGYIRFPITGRPSEPDAYEVPPGGTYRAESLPRADGVAGVSVAGGAVTASLRQTGAVSAVRTVVDLLEDGMSVVSGGPGTFELTALRHADTGEFRIMRASGLVTTNPASLGLTADAGGFRLAGGAESCSYHLELDSPLPNASRLFQHTNVLLAAGAAHWIQPRWSTLGEDAVTIQVDRDRDGRPDEMLIVTNQAPAGMPASPNLLQNNSGFESQPVGTSVGMPPVGVDGATFTGWRVFNVTTNSVAFRATIIANASAGLSAMRLAVTNTGGAANHALDQWAPGMHTPVQPGQRYVVSFDAAWIAGVATSNLLFQVQEFDGTGNFLGNGLAALRSVSTTAYQTHTFIYQPANPATAGVGLFFAPLRGVVGTTTISLDRARLVTAPAPVNGDFESSRLDTSAGGSGVFVNTTALLGWRLFSVGSPPITNLTATIVNAGGYAGGQPGSHALRLSVTNTGSPAAHDYGLDNNNARSPVVAGRKYTLTFDAALVQVSGGALSLNVSVAEFNAAGAFTGTQGGLAPALPADQAFHRYSMTYAVTNPAATQVVIAFRPVTTGHATVVLDNVVLALFVADTPAQLSFGQVGTTLNLSWPPSHLGWRAESNSRNVANPNDWFAIPGSESVTNLNLPVNSAWPAVYYRLRRP